VAKSSFDSGAIYTVSVSSSEVCDFCISFFWNWMICNNMQEDSFMLQKKTTKKSKISPLAAVHHGLGL
jgi:hypothetical protein